MTEGPRFDERHLVGLDKTCPLKVWCHSIACVLTERDRWMQARPFFYHLEQRGLFGAVIFEAKTAPGEGMEDVIESSGSKINSVVSRRDGPRRLPQLLELFCRGRDFAGKLIRLPHKTGVGCFHRFIGLIVKTPVAVKTVAGEPVPLPEGIGETSIDTPGSIKTHQIPATPSVEHSSNCRRTVWESILPLVQAGLHFCSVQ